MAPFDPSAGNFCKIQVESGATDIDLPGINWSLSDMAKSKDVSNFRDGRYRIGTLPDATLNFTLVWDAGQPPHLAANGTIKRGTRIFATLFTDNAITENKAFKVPAIVDQCDLKNEGVEGGLLYDVTALLSGSTTQLGVVTYPTS